MIYADGNIRDEEIAIFEKCAKYIDILDLEGRKLSEDELLSWFHFNRRIISIQYGGADRELRTIDLIEDLKISQNKATIIALLRKIAISDNELHRNERYFIEIIRSYWRNDEKIIA